MEKTSPEGNNYNLIELPGVGLAFRHEQTGEILHGLQGFLKEPQELYIQHTHWIQSDSGPHVIFDVGTGLGANIIGYVEQFFQKKVPVDLHILSFDLEKKGIRYLNQVSAQVGLSAHQIAFLKAAEISNAIDWEHGNRKLRWEFYEGDFRQTIEAVNHVKAHTIIYDFFSQKSHPDLWVHKRFCQLEKRMHPHQSQLLTYATATAIRASLLGCGFYVGEIKGSSEPLTVFPEDGTPPFTRTPPKGTMASRELLIQKFPLDKRWLQRFSRSHLPFVKDETPADQNKIVSKLKEHHQFL